MPAVTIITPVHNHWHLVPKLLACLAAQTLPQTEFEIVLVENNSEEFSPPDQLPPNARIEHCDTPGSYAARNHGIKHATGDWLVFTDADCLPRPDWLQNLMTAASELTNEGGSDLQIAKDLWTTKSRRSDLQIAKGFQTDLHRDLEIAPTESSTNPTTKRINQRTSEEANGQTILAGAIEMIPQNDPPNRWEIYDLVRGIPQAWYVKRGYAATANLAVSAALTKKLEGFDGSRQSGGDAEFCRRAIRQNAQLKYVPEAIVAHPARTSRAELVEKTRRIKAAQIQSGDWRRLRALAPPLIEFWKYLNARHWPLSYRLTAMAVQLTLWPVELQQALKARQPAPRPGTPTQK